jgi:isopentenyl-diphosphate delta-isomerase
MEPKIIIVDEDDNVIGYKDREEVTLDDIYRATALWLTNSKGEILLAKRAYTKTHSPGKWGPAVAGTIEEGETYESNIIKETDEELGIKNVTFEKGPKRLAHGTWTFFCQWFFLKLDRDIREFTIPENEVAEIKWFTREEAKEKIKKNPEEFVKSMSYLVEPFI